jgi:DNA modification methylase
VAIALQQDGWYLRSDIIWNKKNPMPSSVQDRPTMSHEYIFLLSKQAHYFYDIEAIKELTVSYDNCVRDQENTKLNNVPGRTKMEGLKTNQYTYRNKRTVWTITSQPFAGTHFAVFPEKLIEPCVLAGCPEKCCSKCGAPWEKEIEKPQPPESLRNKRNGLKMDFHTQQIGGGQKIQDWYETHPAKIIGHHPSCSCNAEAIPGVVLDPFAGSGTVAIVAEKTYRRSIMIELSEEYFDMICNRIRYGVVEKEKVEQVKKRINMQLLSPEEL